MRFYDANNWYWIVGNRSDVFSSASAEYVETTDATYTTFVADGGVPTRIASEAELGEVLAHAGVESNPFPPVPVYVTMAQARVALKQAGLFNTIDAGLNALSEPQKSVALTAWEYSPNVSRNGALVTTLAGQFGLTEKQLDDLFTAAAAIKL